MNRLMQVSNHLDITIDADVVRYCDEAQVVISILRNAKSDDSCYAVHDVGFNDGISIFWGHYDLTFEEAVDSFNYKADKHWVGNTVKV